MMRAARGFWSPQRWRDSTRLAAAAAMLLLLAVEVAWAQRENWPAWRGDGSGVSLETGLPVEWHEIGYRWRTRIDGVGSSSPIVWGDQVFITTSNERRVAGTLERGVLAAVLVGGAVVTLTLLAGLTGRRAQRRATREEGVPTWYGYVLGADTVGVVLVAAYFFWSAADLVVRRSVGFSPERPDLAWIVAGETVVLGALAAVGSLNARAWSRLIGVGCLSGLGLAFYLWQPPTVSTMPVSLDRQSGVLVPLAAGTLWLLFVWCVVRVADTGKFEKGRGGGEACARQFWPSRQVRRSGTITWVRRNWGRCERYGRWIEPRARSNGR